MKSALAQRGEGENKKGLENQGLLRFLAEQAGFEPAVGY